MNINIGINPKNNGTYNMVSVMFRSETATNTPNIRNIGMPIISKNKVMTI